MPRGDNGTTKWDDKAHSDLLMAMVSEVKFSRDQWAKILSKVHEKGYTYTLDAVTQHINKMAKKQAAAGGGSSAASTPAKPKAAAPKTNGTKRKRAAKKQEVTPEESESDHGDPLEMLERGEVSPVPKKEKVEPTGSIFGGGNFADYDY